MIDYERKISNVKATGVNQIRQLASSIDFQHPS